MSALKIFAGILAALMFVLSAVSGLGFADGIVVTSGESESASTSYDYIANSVFDDSMSSNSSTSLEVGEIIIDEETGLMFERLEDGTYSVGVGSREIGEQLDIEGDFIVPNEYNGKKVTAISGLYGLNKVTSITVPEGIKQIDGESFGGCSNLKRIFLPKSFVSIGNIVNRGFFLWDCDNLVSVDVSEENEYFCSVDGIVFTKDKSTLILYPSGKPATNYAVPDTCKTISSGAFSECNKLTSLKIHKEIEKIKPQAVEHCVNLGKR